MNSMRAPMKASVLATFAALAALTLSAGVKATINGIGKRLPEMATGTVVEKRDVVLTRTFDAPVERVWKAWTDPQEVVRWWGPKGFTSPSCKIDFRVGGKYIFHMRAPKEFQDGQDFYTTGVYKKIVHLKLIEFTQALSDKDGNPIDPATLGMPPDFPKEIASSLTFKSIGGKTQLTATEYGWTVGQMRDLSESGLSDCLDKLAAVVGRP
jgi:uncharacterized protein YndB with AHSA1/START domain